MVKLTDNFNNADMRNICTEAGMFAIRAERDYVVEEDFMKAASGSAMDFCRILAHLYAYLILFDLIWSSGKIADNKKLEGKLDYEKI